MTGAELLRIADELDAYYRDFDDCVARSEGCKWLRVYARGQLGPLERKSLEPIADAEGVAPRTLQWFFMRNGWDEARMLAVHQRRVGEELSGEDGVFVIDETSDAKKGEWTAGVARQYCGESGKIDNCIVSVHIAYVREDRHALLDGELFLPERWNPDSDDPSIADKRQRAQVPETVVHRPKTAMALAQLDRARANGVQGRYVTADELYGGAPWWRAALAERGLIYVVEVPARVCGWIGARTGEAQSLKNLAATHRRLRCGVKARYTTHETAKGPEVWEARRVPFIEQADAAAAVAQDLLVARNVRTGEVKYFLTNAPATLPTPACLKVAFSRWRVGVSGQRPVIQSVKVRPRQIDSSLVAGEVPWRESKTVKPSDKVHRGCIATHQVVTCSERRRSLVTRIPVAEPVHNVRKQQGLTEMSPTRRSSPAGYQRRHDAKDYRSTGETLGTRLRRPVEEPIPITVSGKGGGWYQGGGSGRSTADRRAAKRAGREGPGPVGILFGQGEVGVR